MERLVRTIRTETSIPPNLVPEVIEDLLGLISSELEVVAPDADVEVALSPTRLREQILEWGYRENDISEEDVDRILSRLIQEMARLGPPGTP